MTEHKELSSWQIITRLVTVPKYALKLLITIGAVAFYAIGLSITGSQADPAAVAFCKNETTGWYATLNLVSGGGMARLSPAALGISGFLLAMLAWLLVARIIPALKKDPAKAQKRMPYFVAPVGLLIVVGQALSLASAAARPYGISSTCSQPLIENTLSAKAITAGSMIIGSIILAAIAVLVTKYGLGNGFSILIAAAIAIGIPTSLVAVSTLSGPMVTLLFLLLFVILLTTLSLGAVKTHTTPILNKKKKTVAQWKIPLNVAGILPLVLASIVTSMPSILANVFPQSGFASWVKDSFTPLSFWYILATSLLTIILGFYQVLISYDSDHTSNFMSARSLSFPDTESGEPTRKYVDRHLEKYTALSCLILVILANIPAIISLVAGLSQAIPFSGISMLILVLVLISIAASVKKLVDPQSNVSNLVTSTAMIGFSPDISNPDIIPNGVVITSQEDIPTTPVSTTNANQTDSASTTNQESVLNRAQRRAAERAERKKGNAKIK